MAAPIVEATRRRFEQEIRNKDLEIAAREAAVAVQKQNLEEAQRRINEQVSGRVSMERKAIVAEEARKAKAAAALELGQKSQEATELRQLLDERTSKLTEAQNAHAEVMRRQRALDDEKRELDLTIEKRTQAGLAEVREKTKIEVEDQMKFKVLERDEKIAGMQRQIEELRRKSEQGSQQLQGEVQELHLEAILKESFRSTALSRSKRENLAEI